MLGGLNLRSLKSLLALKYRSVYAVALNLQDYVEDDGALNVMGFIPQNYKATIRDQSSTRDITPYLTKWIAACKAEGAGGRLPRGVFNLADTLTIDFALSIKGEGYQSRIVLDSAVGGTKDVLKIVPAAGIGLRLFSLENFRIVARSGTPGRHAIHIDLSAAGAFVANACFDRLWLDALGGKGFNLTNPVNTDGIFTSAIERSYIVNGIYLQRAGDSVHIVGNVLTGANTAVDLSMVPGAAQVSIQRNNITNTGGAVVIHSGDQVKIRDNQIEIGAAYTGADQALITVKGDTAEVTSTEITGNNINVDTRAAYCVDVVNAAETHLCSNVMNCDAAKKHINVDASAVETIIHDSNDFRVGSASAALKIDDAGVQTFGPPITVAAFSNAWVAYDAANSPVRYSRDADGIVTLEGAVKDGTIVAGTTIFTLPAGFRPSKAIYFAVGNNNAGTWQQGTALVDASGNVKIQAGAATLFAFGGITFKAAL